MIVTIYNYNLLVLNIFIPQGRITWILPVPPLPAKAPIGYLTYHLQHRDCMFDVTNIAMVVISHHIDRNIAKTKKKHVNLIQNFSTESVPQPFWLLCREVHNFTKRDPKLE